MKGKWKKLKSEIVHENPWYILRKDKVKRPNGTKGEYYYVDKINSVAVIAEERGQIYLVGQSRYPIGNIFSWEIITGGLKQGKDPLEAAKNELKEEAGLMAGEWINLGYFTPINGYASEKTFCFLARNLKKTKRKPDATEDIRVKKIKIIDLSKMIKENKITCGMTITTFYKYLLRKESKNISSKK